LKFLAHDFRRVPEAMPPSGTTRSEIKMINFWTHWVEAVRFTCEAQSVISQRLLLLASGGPGSADEVTRMIFEKVDAFAQADIAASQALADGCGMDVAAERAYLPLQRCVHANRLRLSRAVR
jgi:hypothetical protein